MKNFFGWLTALIVIIVFVSLAALITIGFYLSPQSPLEKADAIVVVSGGQTTSRADKGIELYKEHWAPKLIFSGAALDDGISNAYAMRDQALSAGVPARDIYIDEKSQNTYQNAQNSQRILDELPAHKIILVTSPYHQRRANQTFQKVLGSSYQIEGISAYDNRWSKSGWWHQGFPLFISLSEFWKLMYINVTGNYQ